MIPTWVTRGSKFGSVVGARKYHVNFDIKRAAVGLYILYSMSPYRDMRSAQARDDVAMSWSRPYTADQVQFHVVYSRSMTRLTDVSGTT